jgi:nitrogen-specific signal transduction histidine kinase
MDVHPNLAVASAITQQQQASLQTELAKLNQLKDDFLSTTSHELQTPLSNMRLSIQMLEMLLRQTGVLTAEPTTAESRPGKISHYLTVLKAECEREIGLINDLLSLQALEAGTQPLLPMSLPLQDWLLQVVETFEVKAGNQQQQLRIDLSANLPPLRTDFMLLERLLSELLTNACKFTPPEGQITITASTMAGQIQIRVTNSGVEIPTGELTQIFHKFYRVPSDDPWRHKGVGLGLALGKRLAHYLGGDLWAESRLGQTCFIVELPCPESQGVTPTDVLMSYVAYYVSRGKSIVSPMHGVLPFEGKVYQHWGYHRDFLDFWRRLQQRPDFRELFLDGDDHAFRQFLSGDCTVTECARCRLPIPTAEGCTYSTPSCLFCDVPVDVGARMMQIVAIGVQHLPDKLLEASLAANGFDLTFIADLANLPLQALPSSIDLVVIDASVAQTTVQAWTKDLCCYPQFQGVQIVALSAYNRFSLPWTEQRLGIADYLLSPLGGTYLARRLQQISPPMADGSLQLHWFPC